MRVPESTRAIKIQDGENTKYIIQYILNLPKQEIINKSIQ